MRHQQIETTGATSALGIMLGGALAGAALMYFLDPHRGERRRALVRDQLLRAAHRTGDAVDTTSPDVRNRARGVVAELKGWMGGRVVLDGPVLREEVDRLPGNLPGLQGRPRLPRGGEVFELMQSSWSPTARVASGAAGMGTRAWGVRRRDLVGLALMATAVVLVARAIANVPLERWMPTERRAALAERF